ncbi:MAG: putative glycolipid-binding domain-containing protein [Ilumatobacter sp.]|uniref:putative glycolipid-binding domain-containing protein n=1 Tax=Ilumatobacter sp. TaxID=1967498 RepID=UPI00262982D9|nr:putative glycolipid-binding domain-containing protein [Ilumatobacter sp.]MDJ0767695.1 putative glycolipid-binding domain-containing protein [Ilumatobacter sp.]
MTDLLAFPADGFEARWTRWDGGDTESLALRWENEAWTAVVHLDREDVDYVVRLSPLWQVRQLLLFRDLDEPDLWLGTDGRGRWGEVNGAHRPDLDGAHDVFVGGSVFALALPIRRLPLQVGHASDVTALDIDVENLGVVRAHHGYQRLAEHRWAVSLGDERVEFDVDAYGLPHDVDGVGRRLH